MKRFLLRIALTALLLSSTSCGLAELLGRTASNTVQKAGTFTSAVADAAY